MPNRLQNETSLYLLQHSHNPVDWFPWSAEALSAAKNLNRPILLSIGYSACHWCHVMERESFEDIDTAAFMNDHFINIKVDREERPDLDSIYMDAVQALTGRGGWPMTVFLTPDGVPFFGGTYFPPSDRFGMPAFIRVLRSVASTYVDSPSKIQTSVQQLADILDGHGLRSDGSKPDSSTSLHAFESLKASFDSVHGGFGGAPKFPQPLILNYLLRYHLRTHSPQALTIVIDTLHALRSGGIYDALGGGFHRYSTDAAWLVPHFEKMLYDNALLATTYLEAFAVTGNKEFRLVAEETLAYLTRDMMSDNGSFYSSQDADTDGEEGAYFVWTPAQIDAVLGPDITPIVCDYFGVTEAGNFEGATILHTGSDQQQVADRWKLSLGELDDLIGNAKGQLLRQRQRRQSPSRDDKILASWNGLALKAFATAAKILSSSHYAAVAARTANFLLNTLVTDGRIYRTYSGGRVRFHGYLEDYAAVADGLLALYDVTFEPSYVAIAERLAGTMIDQFWDVETGGFYSTGQEHETLIRRPKDMYDNAVPSGQSTAVHVLLQLYALTGRSHYAECAETTLASFGTALGQAPLAFGNMLSQLEWTLSDPIEIAITGSIDRPDTQALLNVTHSTFQPHNVTAVEHTVAVESGIELLRDRSDIDGQAAAYVCQHHTCLQPIQDPEELRGVLLSTRSRGSLTHST